MKNQKRVLIVEDDPQLLAEYAEIITSGGYSVDRVDNMQEAIARVEMQTYHVAVIDVQLDKDDEHNQDGLAVAEAIYELKEGTQTIILSAQDKLQVAIDAFEKYRIAQYLEKRKSKRPSDITTAIDRAFESSHISELGSYRSLSSLLSGDQDTTSWEHKFLTVLRPSGGIGGLNSFLKDLCEIYTPILPRKVGKRGMEVSDQDRCLFGEFWSKGIGEAVALLAYAKDLSEHELKCLPKNLQTMQLHKREKAGVIGAAYRLSEASRENFVERI